ncbi:anthranilate phosphoribosyltransferase [Thiotrichales bacterium 19S9-12]|nr:anthranilate phosphoribosyltransferase [Thiotrichales bacterium 19S9-11]MCF6811820.1 anthranilate phosphoribosyltransferase [Thiotrichales bacterium 19S9-12]
MINERLEQLLDEEVALEEKVKLVKRFNKFQHDGHALAQIAKFFLDRAVEVNLNPLPHNTMDIVGTGGDGYSTLNYSTLAALILSKFGVPIIKHGNKAVTSACGSFDFLEQIGVDLPETPEEVQSTFNENLSAFLLAPYFHPVFKEIAPIRKHFAKIGQKTIFNVLGPLLNPAKVKRMLVGVYEEALVEPMAIALHELGITHAYVVFGAGMDEFSVCGVNQVIQIKDGRLSKHSVHPEQLGFKRVKPELLQAGDVYHNVKESMAIINGDLMGPKRDMLVLNAAAALCVSRGFSYSLAEGIQKIETFLSTKPTLFGQAVH